MEARNKPSNLAHTFIELGEKDYVKVRPSPTSQSIALSRAQMPPKWLHFIEKIYTTRIQPNNPLSANFPKKLSS